MRSTLYFDQQFQIIEQTSMAQLQTYLFSDTDTGTVIDQADNVFLVLKTNEGAENIYGSWLQEVSKYRRTLQLQ